MTYLTPKGKVDLFGSARLKDKPLEAISDKAAELSARLKSVLYFSDLIDSRNLIFIEALNETIEYMQETAFNILLSELLQAVAITDEYNYPLYLDHLLRAFHAKKANLISFTPESNDNVRIFVDMSSLGDIHEWTVAVAMARAVLKIGRSDDMEARSLYWFSKVYLPGREGTPVYSYSRKKGQEKSEKKDVTANYSQKYSDTVTIRLSFLEDDSAPFWYLIENGNSPGTMEDSGGYPYPSIPATRFTEKAEIAIAKIFEIVLFRYLSKVLSDYGNALLEEFMEGSSRGIKIENINMVFKEIERITNKILTTDESLKPSSDKEIKQLTQYTVTKVLEFTRRGKRVRAIQGFGGRFVKSPIPKSKYKRK